MTIKMDSSGTIRIDPAELARLQVAAHAVEALQNERGVLSTRLVAAEQRASEAVCERDAAQARVRELEQVTRSSAPAADAGREALDVLRDVLPKYESLCRALCVVHRDECDCKVCVLIRRARAVLAATPEPPAPAPVCRYGVHVGPMEDTRMPEFKTCKACGYTVRVAARDAAGEGEHA